MMTPVCPSYAGYRFPAEIISHAVWLYFRITYLHGFIISKVCNFIITKL